ncbi:hypothetical protein D3C80_1594700 [compost metagenome]
MNQRGVTTVERPIVRNIVPADAIVPVDRPGHQSLDGMARTLKTLERIDHCRGINHIASGRSVDVGR